MRKPQSEHELLQWSFIRSVAGSDLSKIIAAVPIVGYLILFNDQFAEALSFKTIAGSTASEPSRFWLESVTKLRLAFFGSIFVLIANMMFRVFSPKSLTLASGDLDFCEKVISSYSRTEIVELEKQIISDDWKLRTSLLNEDSLAGFLSKIKRDAKLTGFREKEFILSEYPGYVRHIAREWWAGQMHSKWAARYFTLALASLGYFMLFVQTLDILQAVIRDILS